MNQKSNLLLWLSELLFPNFYQWCIQKETAFKHLNEFWSIYEEIFNQSELLIWLSIISRLR